MIFCAVLGMFILAVVLFLFVPRATMTVLLFMVLQNHYTWLKASSDNLPHGSISVIAIVVMILGVLIGLLIDCVMWNEVKK